MRVAVPSALEAGRTDAVLLCAGRGARLAPLTDRLPKALLPVHGRSVLEHQLDSLRSAGIRRVILVVGYLGDQVETLVGDGRPFGLDVEYAWQPEPRGTGDALLHALPYVRSDPFLVGYTDLLLEEREPIWELLLSDSEPKIAGTHVPDAGGFGRLLCRHEKGQLYLEGISEKDGDPTPGWVNRGLYLLSREIVERIPGLPISPRGEVELTDALSRHAASGGRIRILPVHGVRSVGSPGGYRHANADPVERGTHR